ncbi:protein TRANSPARENT TESTA 9-like [Zingiber officinale]|uniref:protein TRANSPARENT TESTA 9-like n=1 Tax=Zingiber officinale TaxID=94328 RepID=UPI001C4CDB41|nr:protein TRANSPARENT TESTA 9-like [Zingiber officinale]
MFSWFGLWRSRNRFSLDELQYLTDQLQRVQYVNDANKDSVIEVLRSIAELVTYGDQHDPSIFEFFMEKQILGEFARILRISKMAKVAIQLLQTISIMIQNLESEPSIYYIFSNELISYLITYSFDFQNDELLSYYISFIRAISGKLNRSAISLLVKIKNEEIVSFPLYVEAIRFAFHDENMIRIAVHALTLNVYHVGDEYVNKFVVRSPQSDYFSSIVRHFLKRCINLDEIIVQASRKLDASDSSSSILNAVDDIEDDLYYFSDVISSGVPDLGRLLTDNILQLLVFPFLLPSLRKQNSGTRIRIATSLHLLCSILHIFKTKDLASTIAAAFFCPIEAFVTISEATINGSDTDQYVRQDSQELGACHWAAQVDIENSESPSPNSSQSSSAIENSGSYFTLRELLLSYIIHGDELQVLGSLCLLATLLQTKELDESVLDGLGILPQRKQHKKLLLQALVGEDNGEEQLFSSTCMPKDNRSTELESFLLKLEDEYGYHAKCNVNPKMHRYQVLDALVSLFFRSNISAEILWLGGWLLRQLIPHGEGEFASPHLSRLKDSHKLYTSNLFEEVKGAWCDALIFVLQDTWKICKRGNCLPYHKLLDCHLLAYIGFMIYFLILLINLNFTCFNSDPLCIYVYSCNSISGESSLGAAERMCKMVKVFVLLRQLLVFSLGGTLSDLPNIQSSLVSLEISRAKTSGLDAVVPNPGSEICLVDAIPCRIAFERGKERHFCLLAISRGTSGWILLAQESPIRQQGGIVRVAAPLSSSDPKIDEKHPKWLHLRIRPSTLPFLDPARSDSFNKGKTKNLIDGRWTLAFNDEEACKAAEAMLVEEINLQRSEVERRLIRLLYADTTID